MCHACLTGFVAFNTSIRRPNVTWPDVSLRGGRFFSDYSHLCRRNAKLRDRHNQVRIAEAIVLLENVLVLLGCLQYTTAIAAAAGRYKKTGH